VLRIGHTACGKIIFGRGGAGLTGKPVLIFCSRLAAADRDTTPPMGT